MLTLLVLGVLAFGALAALAVFAALFKLILLPIRLAFGLVKLAVLFVIAAALLAVGLPVALIFLLPLVFFGLLVWGTVRLLAA